MISDTSFLSLRGARFLAYASEQAPQFRCPPVIARSESDEAISVDLAGNEIATPRQVGVRNDTEGYYSMLQTYNMSLIYLNQINRD
jgi:hypothetical protein